WSSVVGLGHDVAVMGANTEVISGCKKIDASEYVLKVRGLCRATLATRAVKAGGDRQEGCGAAAKYTVSGTTKLEGADITVAAKTQITIKAGGVTIKSTAGEGKISGDYKSSVNNVDKGAEEYG